MCADWKRWEAATLPMIPTEWLLLPRPDAKAQWQVVKRLLTARTTKEVICATDAGREGELIFRYLVMASGGAKKPMRRLWIPSLTEPAIRAGLANLRPLSEYDRLADAALARARADWLVGMNLSRAYSIRQNAKLVRRACPDPGSGAGGGPRDGGDRLPADAVLAGPAAGDGSKRRAGGVVRAVAGRQEGRARLERPSLHRGGGERRA